jgi:ATP-dependent helicase/nuclease subunit A
VHGAKGLQAPIVFLADTVATPPDDERILWPDEDEPNAKPRKIASIPLFAPSRADEIPEAEARRTARNAKEMAQYRRLLYVALTRAGDRLYVCGYETSKGRSAESWYSLIEAALAGQPTVPIHFDEHCSGPGWRFVGHGRPEKPSEPPTAPRDADFAIAPWMQAPPAPETPPFKPLAPSRPEGDEPPVRSPLSTQDGARFRRGRLIHRLLQTLPDLAPAARAAAARRFLGRRGLGISSAEAEAIAAETLALFEQPVSAALFAPGSLAEVPLTGVVGKTILSGQVDRLAILPGEIRVIDYKTNRAPPRDAAATPPLYVKQMAAYRALLAAIYPGRAVRCFLLWTDGPVIAELSAALLDSHTPEFQR